WIRGYRSYDRPRGGIPRAPRFAIELFRCSGSQPSRCIETDDQRGRCHARPARNRTPVFAELQLEQQQAKKRDRRERSVTSALYRAAAVSTVCFLFRSIPPAGLRVRRNRWRTDRAIE